MVIKTVPRTQKNTTMTMKEWHKYFENSNGSSNPSNPNSDPNKKGRTEILNVISLEFSNTRLETQGCNSIGLRELNRNIESLIKSYSVSQHYI